MTQNVLFGSLASTKEDSCILPGQVAGGHARCLSRSLSHTLFLSVLTYVSLQVTLYRDPLQAKEVLWNLVIFRRL